MTLTIFAILLLASSAHAQLTLGDAKEKVLRIFLADSRSVDSLMKVNDREIILPVCKTQEGDVLRFSTFRVVFDSTDRLSGWSERTLLSRARFNDFMAPLIEDTNLKVEANNPAFFFGVYTNDDLIETIQYNYTTNELYLFYRRNRDR